MVQQVTANDNEWQWVEINGATSDNEWEEIAMSDSEWQKMVQQVKTAQYTSKNGWLQFFLYGK